MNTCIAQQRSPYNASSSLASHGLPRFVFERIHVSCVDETTKSNFLLILRTSISLDEKAKLKVIRAMPDLTYLQVMSIINVLLHEKRLFAKMSSKQTTPQQELDEISFLRQRAVDAWVEITRQLKLELLFNVVK